MVTVKRFFDRQSFYYIIILFLLSGLWACSEEDPDPIDPTPPEEVVDPYFLALLDRDEINRATFAERLDMSGADALIQLFPEKKIVVESLKYRTQDPQQESVAASGIIAYPADGNLKGVIVSEHYTIGANSEAPSSVMASIESALALFGYLVITPDYLGFGTTRELPQPYLHARTAGQTTVDMVFAVQEYMASLGHDITAEPLTVVGYSQGAYSALAFARMAQEEYADRLSIRQIFAGGGPYAPATMLDLLLEQEEMDNPATLLLTVVGLDYTEGLNIDYAALFSEPTASGCRPWCVSKDYTLGQINGLIGTRQITEMMQPDNLLPSAGNEMQKVIAALERNELIEWTPKAPLLLVHGTKDQTVPIRNAELAFNAFQAAGSPVEYKTFDSDHGETAPFFYLLVLQRLVF